MATDYRSLLPGGLNDGISLTLCSLTLCEPDIVFLTKAAFIQWVREALVTLGLNCRDYAGHSFCIGAATMAAQSGLEDSVIRSLGRWNSDAFLRYIRTAREQLATYSECCQGHTVASDEMDSLFSSTLSFLYGVC